MPAPFIFVGTHTLKEGRLEAFKQECAELVRVAEEKEPRLIAFNFYAADHGKR